MDKILKKQSVDFDALGDKHKKLEGMNARQLVPGVPVIARLDGRAFHTLTRYIEKPYDEVFIGAMESVTKELLNEFNPAFAYVQSDEITLAWESIEIFDGRVDKLLSVMASYASAVFNKVYGSHMPSHVKFAVFDCRIWQVADLETVVENVMWREMDAAKNSVNMAAHHMFKQSEIDNLSTKKRIQMLYDRGFDWAALPDRLKRGSFFSKVKKFIELTEEEREKIPAQYRPNGPVNRTVIERKEIPQLLELENPVGVLFSNALPLRWAQP